MKPLAILALAFCVASCTAAAGDAPAEISAEAQSRLAEELRGYAAGQPVSCVNLRDLLGNRSVGDALVFQGRGDLLYVNQPAAACPTLDSGRSLSTRTPSTRLCRGDIARVFDPVSGIEYGGCGLGDFTPYRRIRG